MYLSPLIEDLRKLWEDGVDVWDGNLQQTFRLRAMVFCTINDFPAYRNLSGYSVKGHHACPIYEEDTSYVQLKHGRKTIYTLHRSFLKAYHLYRQLKKDFNGSQEHESASIPLTGHRFLSRPRASILYLERPKRRKKLKLPYGRRGRYCLIFHTGMI